MLSILLLSLQGKECLPPWLPPASAAACLCISFLFTPKQDAGLSFLQMALGSVAWTWHNPFMLSCAFVLLLSGTLQTTTPINPAIERAVWWLTLILACCAWPLLALEGSKRCFSSTWEYVLVVHAAVVTCVDLPVRRIAVALVIACLPFVPPAYILVPSLVLQQQRTTTTAAVNNKVQLLWAVSSAFALSSFAFMPLLLLYNLYFYCCVQSSPRLQTYICSFLPRRPACGSLPLRIPSRA